MSYTGKAKTDSNIAWHRPMSETFRLEEELIERSSRALSSENDPLTKLRLMCLSRGAGGIMALVRIFRRMDTGGHGRLNKDKFEKGLKETGVDLSREDADELFKRFDEDNSGYINLDEFLTHVRPEMADCRRDIVQRVFHKLDKGQHGAVTLDEIRVVYAVTCHPRYMSGEETAEVVMTEFLANFIEPGIIDGKVTLEDFMNFYGAIGLSIDSDCFFDLMMRQAYKL